MSTIEISNALWAACRIVPSQNVGTPIAPSSFTAPDFPANYPAYGVASVNHTGNGTFLIEFEQPTADVELLCQATLHNVAGSNGGLAADALVAEFSIPGAPQASINGGTQPAEYFRQVAFTNAATNGLTDPTLADVLFLHLPFSGQYLT
ncbi:MAG: hypothetical protein ACHREM_15075 [Polyangiales bacterium]